MKLFIKSFFWWSFIFLGLTGIFSLFNVYQLNKWKDVSPASCPKIVFLGDSHAQTAFDSLIFINSLNMAQSSEELVFSYYKLKHLIKLCPNLDTIAISLSYHTLLKYDSKEVNFANESMMRYALIMEDYTKISEWNHHKVFWTYLLYWKLGFPNKQILDYSIQAFNQDLKFDKLPFRGGSIRHQESYMEKADIHEIMNRHFYSTSGKPIGPSRMQLFYLYRILQLCKDKNIHLLFINTPVSKSYTSQMPDKYNIWLKTTHTFLRKQTGCTVFDYGAFIDSSSLFYDHDHLNVKGTEQFSKHLRQAINDSQLRP
jgi:hypothetical protein